MNYRFQFQVIWDNWPLLLEGVWLTLQLSVGAVVLGLLVGTIAALCRLSANSVLRSLASIYVEAVRNTPFLVQLLFIFFGISSLGPSLGNEQAALLALTINFGAYATEIIRAGIESVSTGQIEAGKSLGLNRVQVFRLVVLRPAIANIYPALTGQIVLLMLLSSVVSQISAEELTFMGNFLRSRTFRDFEVFAAIAVIYILLTLLFKLAAQLVHRRLFKFTRYL
ncbi:amino acid ABC transporter permease [Leptolyngbya iicbica]|uniref:Amino acid ABC transporter permease n=2 Tax=Cyanophyceae TaxID=3028117 RepID=A0A4Q7EA42_9CYAN|nr:amino acid ABC transporter permease [Leptolyngbya sp. LK]RZM79383.1 amino acid ABC transporter permease [Leptolyngbya sp. LK]